MTATNSAIAEKKAENGTKEAWKKRTIITPSVGAMKKLKKGKQATCMLNGHFYVIQPPREQDVVVLGRNKFKVTPDTLKKVKAMIAKEQE